MLRTSIRCHLVILIIIVFIGLILRLALIGYVAPFPERYIRADAIGYNQLAINLVSGHGFSMKASAPFNPDNFRTPGYPFGIAAIYALFGYRPDLVLWLQMFLGAITIILTYYLAERISGPDAGLFAAALLAISPHSITYSALLWSDTAYTLLFTTSIILTIIMLVNTNYKWILLAGFAAASAVLIHPRSLYLPILFALCLTGILVMRQKPLKQTAILVLVYLFAFNLVLLPWRLRNYAVFGVSNITSAAGFNMLYYGAALTESARTGQDQWLIARAYRAEVNGMSSGPLNPAEFGELAFRLGLDKISQDPLTYAKVHVIGMIKVFLPGTSQIATLLTGQNSLDTAQIYALFTTGLNRQQDLVIHSLSQLPIAVWGYVGFEILYLGGIYFLAFYAIIKRGRSFLWLWLIVIVLIYLAAVAGPAGSPRFRVVMMPLLSVLAACGLLATRCISRKMDRLCQSKKIMENDMVKKSVKSAKSADQDF